MFLLAPPPVHEAVLLLGFSAEEEAAVQWVLQEKEREPNKVCLCQERSRGAKEREEDKRIIKERTRLPLLRSCCAEGEQDRRWINNPDAEHVRVLWRMEREKRMQVWRRRGRMQQVVRELKLGGGYHVERPVNVEELFMLLPEGAQALASVRKLILWQFGDQPDDGFLRMLAFSAGCCGHSLTKLTL